MIVPVVLGAGALYYLYKRAQKAKEAAFAPPAAGAGGVPSGYSPTPVAPVASLAATQAPAGFAAGSADASPTAAYTFAAGDIPMMVARRFTFNRAEFEKANPGYIQQFGLSPTTNGMMFKTSAFPPGRTINLPAASLDNGPRQGAMGQVSGIVAQGITKDMVPNPPGVTDVQGTLIRETMAANQKAGKTAAQTSADISYWLKNITR